MRNAEWWRRVRYGKPAVQIDQRSVHSAFRIPHSALVSPDLLQLSGIQFRTVAQSEVPVERRRPGARALRPFDEDDRAFARHVVEPEVAGLVGGREPVAV